MKYGGSCHIFTKLIHTFRQGRKRIVLATFYFYRTDVVMARHLLFLNEEIYFHSIICIFRRLAIEEQFIACGSQHLGYNILYEHSFVHFQLIKQQLLIYFRRDNAFLDSATI